METAFTAIQQAYQDILAASIVTGYQSRVADVIAASPTTAEIAADAHATEMAQLLGALERHAGDRNIGLRLPAHETWRKTEAECRPWCQNEATLGCDGYCLSEGQVVLASADGGIMSDDGIAYPVVDVYASVCHPSNAESIGMNLMLPGRAARAFLHMTTKEARQVASALMAEAEQIDDFHQPV